MLQLRDVRLRNSELRRCLGLRQPPPRNQFVDLHRELDTQLTLAGVGEAKIGEDIATADLDRFTFSCHSAPRNPPEPPSVALGPFPHRSAPSGVLTVISSGSSEGRTPRR